MKKHKVLFGVFLAIYLIVLGKHAISDLSWFIFLGFAVAIFAHARANIITLVLLSTHMGIEWYGFGKAYPEIPLILLAHVVLDFIFLHHEVKVHIKKYVWSILAGVTIILFIIFIFGLENSNMIEFGHLEHVHGPECNHGHEHNFLHDFTLGGVIGCVLSHTYFHFVKEK
jgi:hypothetical protein